MKNTVSIIIPCHNVEHTIVNTINAIKESIMECDSSWSWEIVAINDGSEDNTQKILEKIKNITPINHKANRSLSCARNTGIKNSKGQYLAFIDADIVVSKKWFGEMLAVLTGENNIIGVTGTLKPQPDSKMSPLNKYLFSTYRGQQNVNKNTALNYKSFVFSNTIIKRSVLDEVGFFDESLKHYGGEDTELAIRIHAKFPSVMRKIKIDSYHITNKSLDQYLLGMFDYGKFNFPNIIKKHPAYKIDLGYKYVHSLMGKIIFNPVSQFCANGLLKIIPHPLLIKFLVINSFIKGAREGLSQ